MDPWEGGGATHGPGSAQRLSLDEIRTQQQDMIGEQDKGLDHLSRALRRQQEVGLAIQGEITEHNGQCCFVWVWMCECGVGCVGVCVHAYVCVCACACLYIVWERAAGVLFQICCP